METLEEYKQSIQACSDGELEGILKRIDKVKHFDRYQAVQEELKSRQNAASIFLPDLDASPVYAGFWIRLVSSLIDFFLFVVPSTLLLSWLLYRQVFSSPEIYDLASKIQNANTEAGSVGTGISFEINLNLIVILITWLYSALMESSDRQATWGKAFLGIKVTDLEGRRISFGKASIRYFSKLISGLLFGVGFLMAAFTKKKQALHDMMAGCLVVQTR